MRLMNKVEYPRGLRARTANPIFVGSNPTSTSQSLNDLAHGSIAQLAEQTALNRMVAGSILATPTQSQGSIAQWVERHPHKMTGRGYPSGTLREQVLLLLLIQSLIV